MNLFHAGVHKILGTKAAAAIEDSLAFYKNKIDWPSLEELNQHPHFQKTKNVSGAGVPLQFSASPATRAKGFDTLYQARAFLKGEISTRLRNWHDFFNAMIWINFPHTKGVINRRHFFIYDEAAEFPWKKAVPFRNREQDALTIFDEGGAIVVAASDYLLEEFKKLSATEKKDWIAAKHDKEIKVFFFGHAVYEILVLDMHPDLLASGIWVTADSSFFDLSNADQITFADEAAAQWLTERTNTLHTKDFIGVPANCLL